MERLVPTEALTGLGTKAYYHLTGSACMEVMKKDGGTLEAIRSLIMEGVTDKSVTTEYDWDTGVPTGRELRFTSTGED